MPLLACYIIWFVLCLAGWAYGRASGKSNMKFWG